MAHLLRKLQKCRSVDICGSISTELYHNKYGIDQLFNNRNRSFSWEMYVLFRCIPTEYCPIAHFTSILRNKWSKKENDGTLFFINARNRKIYLLFIKKIHTKNPSKNHLRMFSVSHLALSNSSLNFKMKPSTHPPN